MIESATWGGAELRYNKNGLKFYITIYSCPIYSTLQLLLPHDISDELFGTLVGMVPHVFRVANAKILEVSSK